MLQCAWQGLAPSPEGYISVRTDMKLGTSNIPAGFGNLRRLIVSYRLDVRAGSRTSGWGLNRVNRNELPEQELG